MASLKEIKLLISSILIANPLETTIQAFCKAYRSEIGDNIPYNNFGFSSLEEFLKSLPEIVHVHGSGSNAILKVVVNEKVAHLDKLIQNQKVSTKCKSGPLRRRTEAIPNPSFERRRHNVYDNELEKMESTARVMVPNTPYNDSSLEYKFKYPKNNNVLSLGKNITQLLVSEFCHRQGEVQVNIGSVYDPSKFYIILHENYNALEEMMDDMQKTYAEEKQELKIEEQHLKPGVFCVSIYNGKYHRAMVKKVILEKRQVTILFIDYGITDMVNFSDIYFLKGIFAKFPRQAIRARLHDIHPLILGTPWSNEARDSFIDMISGKILYAKMYHVDEKLQIVGIHLYDKSNGKKLFINRMLVERNLAQRDYVNSVNEVHMWPSFEKLEEDIIELPLPQNLITTQLKGTEKEIAEPVFEICRKDQFIIETELFQQSIHVVCVNNKFYITMLEMILLAKLQTSSISLIWKKISELNGDRHKFLISLIDSPDLYEDLRSYGLKNGNNEDSFSMISVEFIPMFFQNFVDVIFPRALFHHFLDELDSYKN